MSRGAAGGGTELTPEPVLDLAGASAEWTRLAERAENVFGTWEWADAWLRHIAPTASPAVARLRRTNGEVVAYLPVCVVREQPVRVARFIGAGISDELGPLCSLRDHPAAAAGLLAHLGDVLGRGGVFLAERLRADEGFARHLGGAAVRRAPYPTLARQGRTFDEFLASRSRNFREQVRRRERKLMREHRLVYRLTDDPDRLDADMATLARLHNARWTPQESDAMRGPRADFNLDFARRALARGWLRLWTLELDGQAAAAWYGLRFGGVETYYQAGRDPGLERLNVGFVLLCHTIRCAFEDGMREYRFGHGDEPYKSRFADTDPGLETVAVVRGWRGRMALTGLRTVFRLPESARGPLLRAGAPS